MARKRYTAEEIIGQLRTIEIELGNGLLYRGQVNLREHAAHGVRDRPLAYPWFSLELGLVGLILQMRWS
jgi:hypothetical protein